MKVHVIAIVEISLVFSIHSNKWVSQIQAPLTARRVPAVVQNEPPGMLYIF